MSDLLEHDLREALADRAARITPQASARLRAVDYRPRSRQWATPRIVGGAGLTGVAAAVGTVILLGSSAAPAFAGWSASPTAPGPGQLTAAERDCGSGSGPPVLTDTRGPYAALIYADGSTCIGGNGTEIRSSRVGGGVPSTPANGTIALNGLGEADSVGHALTMVDGRIGAGVTGVSIIRSDGRRVQATVRNGWYLAWWPGSEHAVTADVSTTSGTATQSFPTAPGQQAPPCPTGAHCGIGYGFGSGPASGAMRSTVQTAGGNGGGQ